MAHRHLPPRCEKSHSGRPRTCRWLRFLLNSFAIGQFFPIFLRSIKGVFAFSGFVREIEKFIIRQPPMGEKDDYDSENSWISDGLPVCTPYFPRFFWDRTSPTKFLRLDNYCCPNSKKKWDRTTIMSDLKKMKGETSDLKKKWKPPKQWKLWSDSCGVRLAPGLKPRRVRR